MTNSNKVKFVNLGCSKNLVDSEYMAGMLNKANRQITSDEDEADYLVINTCAFIEDARKEAIEAIMAGIVWKSERSARKMFVVGCLPQRYRNELQKELPEVDAFFGVGDYDGLLNAVLAGNSQTSANGQRFSFTTNHYRYLRIADGCSQGCSYCAIPLMRGKYYSKPMHECIMEAETLATQGTKELIVIAQEINSYGCDLSESADLIILLRYIVQIGGIEWIRLQYLHPPLVNRELIEFIAAEDKICPYFDFPIEHINERILKRMNRRIDRRGIESKLEMIREICPDCAVRTSLMVGFPGEGEEEFAELADFVVEGWFDRLGVFTFSAEEGTRAAEFDEQVEHETAWSRLEIIMDIQREISAGKNKSRLGQRMKVMVDGVDEQGGLTGRTIFDAPDIDGIVFLEGSANAGDLVTAHIIKTDDYDLYGVII